MDEIKRLYEGDTVEEDCVAVPLQDKRWTWRVLADDAKNRDLPDFLRIFTAIADAAEAPRPWRRDDPCSVGGVDAWYVTDSGHDGFAFVRYEQDGAGHRVPLSVIERRE